MPAFFFHFVYRRKVEVLPCQIHGAVVAERQKLAYSEKGYIAVTSRPFEYATVVPTADSTVSPHLPKLEHRVRRKITVIRYFCHGRFHLCPTENTSLAPRAPPRAPVPFISGSSVFCIDSGIVTSASTTTPEDNVFVMHLPSSSFPAMRLHSPHSSRRSRCFPRKKPPRFLRSRRFPPLPPSCMPITPCKAPKSLKSVFHFHTHSFGGPPPLSTPIIPDSPLPCLDFCKSFAVNLRTLHSACISRNPAPSGSKRRPNRIRKRSSAAEILYSNYRLQFLTRTPLFHRSDLPR